MDLLSLIPNVLSLLRIALTPLCMYLLMNGGFDALYSLILFSFLALSDFYDGYIARKYHFESRSGSFLDPLADKVLVLGVLSAFYLTEAISIWVVIIIAARDVLVTALRSTIVLSGGTFATSRLAKWKTALQYLVLYTLYASTLLHDFGLARGSGRLVHVIIYGVLVATVYSGLDYCVKNAAAFASALRALFRRDT